MKITVNRNDSKQVLNITQAMWDNGISLVEWHDGISIGFFNKRGEETGGTFIPTIGICSWYISSFIFDIERHISSNKKIVITNNEIIINK